MPVYDEWKPAYSERLGTAEAALGSVLEDGSRLYLGSGCGEPRHLARTLVSLLPDYQDCELTQNLSVGELPEDWVPYRRHCRLRTFLAGPRVREAVNLGLADYVPIYASAVPRLLRESPLPLDCCLLQVAPPDAHGYCSLGIAVDVNLAAARAARVVIAQVNREMPRTLGDSFLHVSEITRFVEHDEPLLELAWDEQSAVAERIARYVSSLVEDGATVQTGMGRVAGAVLRHLLDKSDLGIHTELLTDAHLHLVTQGVITGAKKTLHRGKIIAAFAAGSRALYGFVHNNPQVEFHPTEYVNDSRVIAKNAAMTAINSAIEVDLSGQVCADSIGYKVFSGIGGHVDFMLGAASSPGGKTIIVLPSTSMDGRKSRIVSHLTEGAGVVSSRATVQYVVTEFGVASLAGKAVRERAMALVNIAHPRYRERLLSEAKARRYVYQDQILPPVFEPLYPGQYEMRRTFRDGLEVFFRPLKPSDERALQEFFYSLPDQDIYTRFLSAMKVFPHRDTQAMVNIDYEHEMAIVGTIGEIGSETIVAIGRYILDQKSNMAEVDFAVRSEWQKHGIGGFLLHTLCEIGKGKGVTGFTAYVLAQNRKMMTVFHKVGYEVRTRFEEGIYDIAFRFDEPARAPVPQSEGT